MKSKIVLFCLIAFLLLNTYLLIAQNNQKQIADNKPNIIFILADDLAVNAVSAYNPSRINTPNIDRLASEGIKFNNCLVTNSICAPSRAVMLTGKYSHMNGLRDNRDVFNGDQQTFPKLLQNAGYQTALIGKWHLKSTPQGFDYWNIVQGQGLYYNPQFIEMGDTIRHTGYVSDLITDFVFDYLEKSDKEKPFCLLYHHKSPHRNWMPNIKDLAELKIHPEPETLNDDYTGRIAASQQDLEIKNLYNSLDLKINLEEGEKEYSGGKESFEAIESWKITYNSLTPEQKNEWDEYYEPINKKFREANFTDEELFKWKYQRYINYYLLCVKSIDDNLGRLFEYLDKNNLSESTMVILSSDQGFFLGEHGWYDKRFMYEESIKIPMLIRYPREIEANQASDKIILNLDFAPTLLDFAGINIPSDMQGKSFKEFTLGKNIPNWRNSMYYHYYEYPHGWHDVKRHYGIRTEKFKLIHFYYDIDEWELFDLESDPNEMNNLINDENYFDLIEKLKNELYYLQDYYNDNSVSD
jgi:arylsulfatase A-like enzyme